MTGHGYQRVVEERRSLEQKGWSRSTSSTPRRSMSVEAVDVVTSKESRDCGGRSLAESEVHALTERSLIKSRGTAKSWHACGGSKIKLKSRPSKCSSISYGVYVRTFQPYHARKRQLHMYGKLGEGKARPVLTRQRDRRFESVRGDFEVSEFQLRPPRGEGAAASCMRSRAVTVPAV